VVGGTGHETVRQVLGWGNPNARYILIGEAPGESEELKGEPFCGASGYRLNQWWQHANLTREDFYIDNVCQYRPPHNNIDAFDADYLKQWMSHLQQRIANLGDPYVLIPTGNYALYALTGKGKVKWHQTDGKSPRPGITDWRGSILSYTDLHGRTLKVIPTIHPAATFRQPDLEGVCIRDWIKIAKEGTFKDLNLPQRTHAIAETVEQVEDYFAGLKETDIVAVDIENPRDETIEEVRNESTGKIKKVTVKQPPKIVCIAFSHTPSYSLTVPTTTESWNAGTLSTIWTAIRRFLERSDIQKVFHNGLYDCFHLTWEHGIRVASYQHDTLYHSHCLDPSDQHSLAYCASHDTRQVFWKHDFKDPDEIARQFKYDTQLAFWQYNGLDACVTRELYDVYTTRLRERGMLDFYLKHYGALLAPLQDLQLHGIRIDDEKRKLRLAHLMADCLELQDQLEEITGYKLHGKTSLSNDKLKHYLYTVLGLPKQERKRKKRGEKTLTVDGLAVRRLQLSHQQKMSVIAPLILTHKRKDKLTESYDEDRVDVDGRFRSSYSMNTEAGRLSSSTAPHGRGFRRFDKSCFQVGIGIQP